MTVSVFTHVYLEGRRRFPELGRVDVWTG
jgi:hypothetical protein